MSASIDSRKGVTTVSGGRGGAGNLDATSSVEYVDGGMYREGIVGENGEAYSTGRGGLGNIGGGTPSSKATSIHNGAAAGSGIAGTGSRHSIDRYPNESVRTVEPGMQASSGRGGAGNIGEPKSQDVIANGHGHGHGAKTGTVRHGQSYGAPIETQDPHHVESNPRLESGRLERKLSHLGLADKIKFGLFPMTKKNQA